MGGVGISMPNCLPMPFKVRPGVLSKTLSHMWGKLNLPIFLFDVGLLTLIKIEYHQHQHLPLINASN